MDLKSSTLDLMSDKYFFKTHTVELQYAGFFCTSSPIGLTIVVGLEAVGENTEAVDELT